MAEAGKLAVLIPEFPGQTHSFFWREIEALETHHGVDAQIISTRLAPRPVWHDWVEKADAIQLYPVSKKGLLALFPRLLAGLPRLISDPDLRPLLRQPKIWGFVLMALHLGTVCRARGLTHMHVHSCANFALIAALCHRLTGISYSLVLHGPLHDYGQAQAYKWRDAAFVFVITETLGRDVAAALPRMHDKVQIVPMGVDTDVFTPANPPRPAPTAPFVWFSCARLNRVKGHDTVIAAAKILRRRGYDIKIRIAGEDEQGGTGYHHDLDRLIAEAGLEDVIELMGGVTQEAVRDGLRAADGFVLASRHEPLGVAYMEAMACALPVIGTRAGGVTELISHETDGLLVPPDDSEALADAMAHILDHPDKAAALGQAGRAHIIRNFSARRSADALAAALSG